MAWDEWDKHPNAAPALMPLTALGRGLQGDLIALRLDYLPDPGSPDREARLQLGMSADQARSIAAELNRLAALLTPPTPTKQ